MRKILGICVLAAVLGLAACASPPSRINDVCAVFDQRDGWFNNWRRDAEKSARRHGIPVPVLMATIRKESGFKGNARPKRKYILWIIPWGHESSALGYSQALDGTWKQYKRESGNSFASRKNFGDAVDFVGWYHEKTVDAFGVAPGDTYNLYLAYYYGWGAYKQGAWRKSAGMQKYARDTAAMAENYADQMKRCD